MKDNIHSPVTASASPFLDFTRLRRLELAIIQAARKLGIKSPDLYDQKRAMRNCLSPIGLAIFYSLPRELIQGDMRTPARQYCESVARAANGDARWNQ
jgi:hypothetical protein